MPEEPADPLDLFAGDEDDTADKGKTDAGLEALASSPAGKSPAARSRSPSARSWSRGKSPPKSEQRKTRSASRDRSASRSSSGSRAGDSNEARLKKHRKKIEQFVEKNKISASVVGIMQNMHPVDVKSVMSVPWPQDCRNPSGFIVSHIRKAERDNMRPKDFRWDGKNWDKAPVDKSGGAKKRCSRSRSRNRRGRDRDRDRDRERRRGGHRGGRDRKRRTRRKTRRKPRMRKGRMTKSRKEESRDDSYSGSRSASYSGYSGSGSGDEDSRSRSPSKRRRR